MRALKRAPTTLGALMALVVLLVGCTSTLYQLSTGKTLDGYSAKDIRVVVPEPYSLMTGFVLMTLPAGTYTPKLESDKGVYFQSPSKILSGELFTSPVQVDGGLFFKGGVSTDVYLYIISQGNHSELKLPSNFKFRVERKP